MTIPTHPHRKPRYDVGDRVELYPEPTHEYPHPDDQYAIAPVAIVRSVNVHPNNDEYVLGYVVETLNDFLEQTIKPGKIARLAPDIVVHHFEHGTSDAYAMTQTRDVIRDGDVLVVVEPTYDRDEQDDLVVVGFLAGAWPVAITPTRGQFHALVDSADITCLGKQPEHRTTYVDRDGVEREYVIDADPGRDYTKSVELAQRELASINEHS